MRFLICGTLLGLAGVTLGGPSSYRATYHRAPTHARIHGHYMVVLQPGVPAMSHLSSLIEEYPSLNLNLDGSIYPPAQVNTLRHTFTLGAVEGDEALEGFAGALSDELLAYLLEDPDVKYVEEDHTVSITNHQEDATWGLSRISHRALPRGKNYTEYSYDDHAGRGTQVYVIDTGIYCEHSDFEGRARFGTNLVKTDPAKDLNGHGTHCAGTIAGKTYGVAKKANLVAVKVLDGRGSGSMSDVVKGVEWTIKDHRTRIEESKEGKPVLSAANMSLGGGKSPTLNRAVNAAVHSGIHFSVAAGNDDNDACLYSPASAANPMTVGASTIRDSMAYFSNHGNCVDLFAPGHHILSTWIGKQDATNVLSGTSMASPHVAGLFALHLSVHCSSTDTSMAMAGNCTTTSIKDQIVSQATTGVLRNLPDGKRKKRRDWPFPWEPEDPDLPDEGKTPNRLAFVIDEDEADMQAHQDRSNEPNGVFGYDEMDGDNMIAENGGYLVKMVEGYENNPFTVLFHWFFG